MKLLKLSAAIALTLTSALGTGVAYANAYAIATVEINDFNITLQDTGATFDAIADADNLQFQAGASTLANVDSIAGVGFDSANTTTASGTDLYASEGAGGPGNVSAPGPFTHTIDTTQTFAVGDQYELGAPITNLVDSVGNTFSNPADIGSASYASVASGDTDNANAASENTLGATWTFTATVDDELVFSFDVTSFLSTFVDEGVDAATFAQGEWSISFVLTDNDTGAILLNASLGDTLSSISALDNGTIKLGIDNVTGLPVSFISGTLTAGNDYTLSASLSSAVRVGNQAVPEPATLTLMGMGLLGFASRLRRNKIG